MTVRNIGMNVHKDGMTVPFFGKTIRKNGMTFPCFGMTIRKDGMTIRKNGMSIRKDGTVKELEEIKEEIPRKNSCKTTLYSRKQAGLRIKGAKARR